MTTLAQAQRDEMAEFGDFGSGGATEKSEDSADGTDSDNFGIFGQWERIQSQFGIDSVEMDDLEFIPDENEPEKKGINVLLNGNVHIKAEHAEIFANKARFNTTEQKIYVDDDVSIYKNDGFVYRGDAAVYDTKTGAIDAEKLRSSVEPIYFEAGDFEAATRDISVINLKDAILTTHDNAEYDYHFRAKEMKIYPEDKVVMKHVRAYVGDIPVFYFPRITQAFDEELGYRFTPGYRSNWGAFLASQYGQLLGDHSILTYHLDYRTTRGIAGGIDLSSRRHRENPNFGNFKSYYAQDSDPLESISGTREDRSDLDEGRYRINLQHRIYLPGPEESTFYLDVDLNKVSDEFFYEDFFPTEFLIDPRPDNVVNIVKQFPRGELSLMGRFRVNDFFMTNTRSPEIALDFVRHPILNSGLFYTSTTSAGVYKEELADQIERSTRRRVRKLEDDLREATRPGSDLLIDVAATTDMLDDLNLTLADSGFARLNSYHELSFPRTIGGWLSLVPRVGIGATAYSDIDGPQPTDDSRTILHAGVEASFKMSKTYDWVQMPDLGVDGIKHVLQPYFQFSYTNSDDLGDDFRRIDRLVPSTRPRPLDVPEFTAIDDLHSWTVVRTGVYNRFFTRRNSGAYQWLAFNTWFDTFVDDPEFDRDFSNLYNDIQWSPLPWLRLAVGSQLPVFGGEDSFSEVITRLTWMPTNSLEFTVGNRSISDHPFFEDSNIIDFRAYARINDNWGIGTYHRFELEDGTLERQQITLHKDLTSWTASLGAMMRDNRGSHNEFGLIFMLTLKDFPQLSIPIDVDPNPGGGQ
jgi:LPS-assembly protein